MAVEVAKVLAVFETKFKGKSLSKNFKKSVAEKWAPKIDNDADIDDYVTDREDVLLEAAAEGDRRASSATKLAQKEAVKKVSGEDIDVDDDQTKKQSIVLGDDAPEWAKALVSAFSSVSTELKTIKDQKATETLEQRFKKDDRLKNVPEFGFKGRVPKTEEEFDEAVQELANDFKDYAKPGSAVPTSDRPRIGVVNRGDQRPVQQNSDEAKVPDAIKAFTANLNKQNNSQPKV